MRSSVFRRRCAGAERGLLGDDNFGEGLSVAAFLPENSGILTLRLALQVEVSESVGKFCAPSSGS